MNQPTLPPSQSALPERGIDRLFSTLWAMYGKHWLDLWSHCNVEDVKAEWAAAMSGLDNECIRLALDNLRATGKAFPPTQPEFVSLCNQFKRRGPHTLSLVDKRRTDGPKGGFQSLREVLRKARD
jgi:hypothetical protein